MEESTVGLIAKRKSQPKTVQVPRQILNLILNRIGVEAPPYPTLIENGNNDDDNSKTNSSSKSDVDSLEDGQSVNLSSEQVFELFNALFSTPLLTASAQNNNRSAASNNNSKTNGKVPDPSRRTTKGSKGEGKEEEGEDYEYMVTEPPSSSQGEVIERAYSIDSIDSIDEKDPPEKGALSPNRNTSNSNGNQAERRPSTATSSPSIRFQLSPVNIGDVVGARVPPGSSSASQFPPIPTTPAFYPPNISIPEQPSVRHESVESADISLGSGREVDHNLYFKQQESLDSQLNDSNNMTVNSDSMHFSSPIVPPQMVVHQQPVSPSNAAASKLAEALDKLRQVI